MSNSSFQADDPEANLNLSVRLLCALSFVVLAVWLWYFGTNVRELRQAEPSERFRFCRQLTINLCLISAVLGVVQISELDDVKFGERTVDFGRYIEWVFTCPLTQLQLMVFAGPDCTSVGVWTPCRMTFCVLLAGAIASYVNPMPLKSGFFVLSSMMYMLLLYTLNRVVEEVSQGKDRLWKPVKPESKLFCLVASSWSVFPILWILSPEGFNLADHFSGVRIGMIMTICNAVVKLTFMAAFQHVRVSTLKDQSVEHERRVSEIRASSKNSCMTQTMTDDVEGQPQDVGCWTPSPFSSPRSSNCASQAEINVTFPFDEDEETGLQSQEKVLQSIVLDKNEKEADKTDTNDTDESQSFAKPTFSRQRSI